MSPVGSGAGMGLGFSRAPHKVSDLIGFLQAIHAAPQPVLIPMFARTKVPRPRQPRFCSAACRKSRQVLALHFHGKCRSD